MISYHPPKAQAWGHSARHLSPVRLYELVEAFLGEHTISAAQPRHELTIVWEPAPADPISAAVDCLPFFGGDGSGDYADRGADGRYVRRISRQLLACSLRQAVEWIESLGPDCLAPSRFAFPALHQNILFRWRHSVAGQPPESPRPQACMLGVSYCAPRTVSTMFNFDSVQQYRTIQRYLAEIGLVTLSDRHIRPKDAIQRATNAA